MKTLHIILLLPLLLQGKIKVPTTIFRLKCHYFTNCLSCAELTLRWTQWYMPYFSII